MKKQNQKKEIKLLKEQLQQQQNYILALEEQDDYHRKLIADTSVFMIAYAIGYFFEGLKVFEKQLELDERVRL